MVMAIALEIALLIASRDAVAETMGLNHFLRYFIASKRIYRGDKYVKQMIAERPIIKWAICISDTGSR